MGKIRDWFVGVWTSTKGAIAKFFEGPGGVIVRSALGNALDIVGNVALSALLDAARGKVAQLNTTQLTNPEKRLQAMEYLKNYSAQAGIEVGESVVRYVLETAVQSVKGDAR